MNTDRFDAVTVTLNPAIDRTVTIPNFTAGVVNRVETVRSNPGGKGVNVAVSLANAGHRAAVTGLLGRENSATFEALFRQKKIVDHFVRIAGQTRVGIKIADPALHQTTDINFPGPEASASDVSGFMHQLAVLDASCFVLAGSLPPGVDAAIYERLVTVLKSRGKRVVLDASGEPLRLAIEAKPHLFKPNIHELGELLGSTPRTAQEIVAAARQLIARGIEEVVVSMGKEGACFVTANEAIMATPPDVEVRSTVGAGDAMVAGIVSAQLHKLSLAESARIATAFSVHALTRGADGSDFTTAIGSIVPQVITTNIE